MPTHFKLPRRKIGVATLAMACLFAVGWVQSRHSKCWFDFRSDSHHHLFFIADNSRLCLVRMPEDVAGHVESIIERGHFWISRGVLNDIEDLWSFGGFALGRNVDVYGEPMDALVIPGGSIVIPLTLLSAWLLLSKPRAKKPEPILPGKEERQS